MSELYNNQYLDMESIECEKHVVQCFERTEGDYLPLYDNDKEIGYLYIDDFCENNEIIVTKKTESGISKQNEEQLVLKKLLECNEQEKKLIENIIIDNYPKGCVFCCTSLEIAEAITFILFKDRHYKITYIHSVLELSANDNVVFLEYKRIKLYRKCHVEKINSFLVLDSVINEAKNHVFFDAKYPDMFNYLTQIGVEYLYAIIPDGSDLNSLTEYGKERIKGWEKIDVNLYKMILGGANSPDYKSCMFQKKVSRVVDNGIYNVLCDCVSEYYNVTNGMRFTANQPIKYKNIIYMFGPCIVRGAMVEDKHTIASILQNLLTDQKLEYLVLNCGVGGGSNLENTYKYILSLPLKTGDIIVMIEDGSFLKDGNFDNKVINLSNAFNERECNDEWFLDRPAHCNRYGNKIISQEIFDEILKLICRTRKYNYTSKVESYLAYEKYYNKRDGLNTYLNYVHSKKFNLSENEYAGSIVMHGNPMTNGHKHLIETALKYVDFLYIFILSEDRSREDKSELPALFRKQLLLHETQDFENVRVIDGGNIMASVASFPEYFEKERVVDLLN